jgi:uncharacterized membrane protein YgcG
MNSVRFSNPAQLTLFFFLLISLCSNTFAVEEILNFQSDVEIHPDRRISVIETIIVNAEGKEIRRGIYRDFPTDYRDKLGNRYRVAFDVRSVNKDGADEPFKTQRIENGVRVYIGRKDVVLTPGVYRYEIHYQTDRQLGFFEQHDELYWNATGNGWNFPIKQAGASIKLPSRVDINALETDAYTGPQGASGKNFSVYIDDLGVAHFTTTAELGTREGLTVVLAWPKGVIAAPSASEQFARTMKDNIHLLFALFGSVSVALYYLLTWRKVGQDPEKGILVGEYEPPPGYSPASMRFIEKMSYDPKCFTAALINLAVKGYLTISEDGGKYTLRKTGTETPLAPGEAALANGLFGTRNSAILEKRNHAVISNALGEHERALSNDYENKYFKTNRRFFFIGIALSVAVIVVTAIFAARAAPLSETAFLSVFASIWWFVIGAALIKSWGNFKRAYSILAWAGAILNAIFLIPFVWIGVYVLTQFYETVNWLAVCFLFFVVSLNILFYQLLKAPTLLGRKLLDKVDGFRHYVEIAEKHELDYQNAEGRTPELFERYLPYALALGIDQQWSDQFHAVLTAATVDGEVYAPLWYQGSSWDINRANHFTRAFGSGLTQAIASSSTPPGSSSGAGSGSFGGGSSGGGGGGGGGGGW